MSQDQESIRKTVSFGTELYLRAEELMKLLAFRDLREFLGYLIREEYERRGLLLGIANAALAISEKMESLHQKTSTSAAERRVRPPRE